MRSLCLIFTAVLSLFPTIASADVVGATFLNATNNDDNVVIDTETLTFTVNGVSRGFTVPSISQEVCVDGRDGFDKLTVYMLLNPYRNEVVVDVDEVAIELWRLISDLNIVGFEEIDCIPLNQNDTNFYSVGGLQDDYLVSTETYTEYSNSDVCVRYFGPVLRLRATQKIRGGHDVAEIYGSGRDDTCRVFGDYDEILGGRVIGFVPPTVTLRSVRTNRLIQDREVRDFDVVKVNVNQGGRDDVDIKDSPRRDQLTIRGAYARWQTPKTDVRLHGFDDLIASSFRSSNDAARVEDTQATFDPLTGDIQDNDPNALIVAAPTYISSTSSKYRNIARGFDSNTIVPNGVNSQMNVYTDVAGDPKFPVVGENNDLIVVDRDGEPTRPSHILYVEPNTMHAYWLRGFGSRERPPTASLTPNSFYSAGATQVNGMLVPPTSVRVRDYSRLFLNQSGFCDLTVGDSPGDDSFRLLGNKLTAMYSNGARADVVGAGPNINFRATISSNAGHDSLHIDASEAGMSPPGSAFRTKFNMVVDGENHEVAFVGDGKPTSPEHVAKGFDRCKIVRANNVRYHDSKGGDRANSYGVRVELSATGIVPFDPAFDVFSCEVIDAGTVSSTGIRGGSNNLFISSQSATELNFAPGGWSILP